MRLETDRLSVIPLTLQQFSFFLECKSGLEGSLGLLPSGVPLDLHTDEAMRGLYAECERHEGSVWYTYWLIISKEYNTSIGGLCFMSEPMEGVVELGYGIDAAFQNHGYMTEALGTVITWAFTEGALCITAQTEKDNPASHAVLRKSGFSVSREDEDSLWWVYRYIR
ncbi:MAG: GNAT family protein [Methanocorpusculum sp.]|nr:GNAT family protein [Methanocorpusculum sp.]